MKLEITRTIPKRDGYPGLTEGVINGRTFVTMSTGKEASEAIRRAAERK